MRRLVDTLLDLTRVQMGAEVPLDLSAVVMRCLAKKPEERFATVAELDAALAACGCAGDWGKGQAADWWTGRQG